MWVSCIADWVVYAWHHVLEIPESQSTNKLSDQEGSTVKVNVWSIIAEDRADSLKSQS